MKKIIYYYQTLIDLEEFIKNNRATHIILSSIHFGFNNNELYIHLNDSPIDSDIFNKVWKQLKVLNDNGLTIMVMMGGAGLAYNVFFDNYEKAYKLLTDFITNHEYIKGIDLDIEETTNINNVKTLINFLKQDYPKFIITMAPLSDSLTSDNTGMGNFVYKDLYNSPEGAHIDWFNGQFYGSFNLETYTDIINNGYPANKIVLGMLTGTSNIDYYKNEIKKIKGKYPDFSGVDVWELVLTVKDKHMGYWSEEMFDAIYN